MKFRIVAFLEAESIDQAKLVLANTLYADNQTGAWIERVQLINEEKEAKELKARQEAIQRAFNGNY